jgi:hypothetical protein
MKPIKSLLVLAILCAPALASAQGRYSRGGRYQGAPSASVPGGFHDRAGRLAYGFSVGLGGMHDGGSAITSCRNCDFSPLTLEGDFHIGGMMSPRFALLFEAQGNIQTIHSDFIDGDTVLSQGAAMIAGQFWVLPQLWIKGGIGFAHLQVDDAFFIEDFGTGGALMGAVGIELFSARNFSLDLQGRIIQAAYNSLDDNVTSGTIGIGVNWY